jgi:hypothetical protein
MRCASWAGSVAGKIKIRAENIKAALNLSKHFIVRIVRGIGFVDAAETSACRQASKPDQWALDSRYTVARRSAACGPDF